MNTKKTFSIKIISSLILLLIVSCNNNNIDNEESSTPIINTTTDTTHFSTENNNYNFKYDFNTIFPIYDIRDATSLYSFDNDNLTVEQAIQSSLYSAEFDFAYATTTSGILFTKEKNKTEVKDEITKFSETYANDFDYQTFKIKKGYKFGTNIVSDVKTVLYSSEQGYSKITFDDKEITLKGYIRVIEDEGYAIPGDLEFYPLPESFLNLPKIKSTSTTLYKKNSYGLNPIAELDTPRFRLENVNKLLEKGIDISIIPQDGEWSLISVTLNNLYISDSYGTFDPSGGDVISFENFKQ